MKTITAQSPQGYRLWFEQQMANKVWGDSDCKHALDTAKAFARRLWELELIELPRNLRSRDLSIRIQPVEIKHFDTEQVKLLLAGNEKTKRRECFERARLYCLLMCHCGFTSVDIGRAKRAKYVNGTITRKRSKTQHRDKVPEVTYRLWNETQQLLNRYMAKKGDLLLVNERGGPLWEKKLSAQEKRRKNDYVARAVLNYAKQLDVEMTPKMLRATAGQLLEKHTHYKYFIDYFHGCSPRSVKEKHYTTPHQG